MSTRPAFAPLAHEPALDGLRGIAIVAVLLFHLGLVGSGFLGVDLFFVLSGFLVTRLLLAGVGRTGRIGLAAFWAGRLRRLLPAALVTIGAIAVLAIVGVFAGATLRLDLGAALAYVGNWRLVVSGDDYADQFGPASPVRHFWSLAVEEQFYVAWPLLVGGAALVSRRRGWPIARTVILGAAGGAALSAALLWLLHDPDAISRTYYGTDTRAFGPLIGAALGARTARLPVRRSAWRRGERLGLGVLVGAGVLAVSPWTVTSDSYYRGGAVLFALGIAGLIVVALARPVAPLSWPPLCWVGTISYGLYLYHWPIFAVLSPERTGWSAPSLAIARIAVTFAVAAASVRWLEQPIRAGRLPRRVAPVAFAGATALVLLAVVTVPVPEPLVDLAPIDLLAAPPSPPPAGVSVLGLATLPTNAPLGPVAFSIDPASLAMASAGAPTPRTQGTTTASTTPTLTANDPASTGPLRILVIGDSVGNNLGAGLERWGASGEIVAWNRSLPACGFELEATIVDDVVVDPTCPAWHDRLGTFVDQFQPDVVLVVTGRLDQARRVASGWEGPQRVGDPDFDHLMGTAYDRVLGTIEVRGPTVVVATYPCIDERWVYHGELHPDGRPANETNAAFNRFLRGLGRPILDLDARVCPGGTFTSEVEGVAGSRPDGFHLSAAAADALAPWLVGELARLR